MRIAVYPGTFDPVTNGHLDITRRAVKLFDKVILAVAQDNNKNPLFSLQERQELLKEATKDIENTEVRSFSGLTVHFARECGAKAMIRGMRALTDFEFEFQLALMNKKLDPTLETVFLMTKSDFSYISSSTIKWAARLDANISEFVPKNVENALMRKYNKLV